jgi:hypothetical protein
MAPLTVPVPSTVAIPVEAELHPPPDEPSDKAVVCPAHTVDTPVMDDGTGLTITTVLTAHPVGSV